MIDVIIPAYQAHKTIARTLASIAMQTIADQLHVVIVNDAPGDSYKKLAERFSGILKIRELKMKRNGGPGAARQFGIDHTGGEYITFIDADDTFYNAFALERLYHSIKDTDYNLVTGIFVEQTGDGRLQDHIKDATWMFGKLYRRTFLKRHRIRFTDGRANEDSGFNALFNLCNEEGKTLFLPEKSISGITIRSPLPAARTIFLRAWRDFARNKPKLC